jgi:preprotein translocase subunit SecG
MSLLSGVLIAIHILVCIALVAVILLQRSEGGALGMGGGPSGFMSARGAGNLLTRTTSILAGLFFALSLALTLLHGGRTASSVTDRLDIRGVDPTNLGPATPGAPGSTAPGTTGLPTAPGTVTPASPGIGAESSPAVTGGIEAPRPTIQAPLPAAPAPTPSAPPAQ